ncbi:MAG: chemotaxis protein histidine kinaselike protein, partial [Armatimonadetes bacterium]|nr:chemotaxis protein histidine kinaselike protein [Armatimonadota bacterium]
MFEDEELVSLFKMESEERLQNLDQGLLRLEANPTDTTTLEELFREAHNLKGAARMLGAVDVGRLAHRFEDILGEARRGDSPLSADRIDGLSLGLDALRKLVAEIISGVPSGVDLERILAVLSGWKPAPARPGPVVAEDRPALGPGGSGPPAGPRASKPPSDLRHPNGGQASESAPGAGSPGSGSLARGIFGEGKAPEPYPRVASRPGVPPAARSRSDARPRIEELPAVPLSTSLARERSEPPTEPEPKPEGAAPAESPTPPAAAAFRIETIRVEPQRLDALLTHAGELIVTKSRIARRLVELERLVTFQEEWVREARRTHGYRSSEPDAPVTAAERLPARERLDRLGALLAELQSAATEDVARLEFVADQLEDGIRSIRLLPLSTIFNLFPRMVRDLSREQGKEVRLLIEGGAIAADKRIVEEIKDPLMHILRNAVDHGIESPVERDRAGKPREAKLRLRATQTATNVVIEVEDDGRGIDLEAIRRTALKRRVRTEEELAAMGPREISELIFAPGFSTRAAVTDVSGRGVGLDVVRKNVDFLKGFLEVESRP